MSQLSVRDITVKFGGITALDSASFDVEKGQICGLIGPNGAGKTTLFNVVSRIYDPTEGSVEFEGQDLLALQAHEICEVGAYRTFQNLALWKGLTVLENVMVGAHHNVCRLLAVDVQDQHQERRVRPSRKGLRSARRTQP